LDKLRVCAIFAEGDMFDYVKYQKTASTFVLYFVPAGVVHMLGLIPPHRCMTSIAPRAAAFSVLPGDLKGKTMEKTPGRSTYCMRTSKRRDVRCTF
jgi:hypothetical protein